MSCFSIYLKKCKLIKTVWLSFIEILPSFNNFLEINLGGKIYEQIGFWESQNNTLINDLTENCHFFQKLIKKRDRKHKWRLPILSELNPIM